MQACIYFSVSTFQDYTQPIISTVDLMIYMNVAKRVFNLHWIFLDSLHGLDADNNEPYLRAHKERQIFSQLMMFQCVTNYKGLTHLALVQTTSHYTNGMHAIVVETSQFDGMTVNTTFQYRQYMYLTKGAERLQHETLRTYMVANFTYNNVTAIEQLWDTSGKFNKFLNDTYMAVHMVSPYSTKNYSQ